MITRTITIAASAALIVTIASLVTWRVTGGDYYTKFELIEQIESPVDPDDPLAGSGFYDGEARTETVVTPGLRFGLLPTPNGIFDKHILSVATLAAPPWVLLLGLVLIDRRRRRIRTTPSIR